METSTTTTNNEDPFKAATLCKKCTTLQFTDSSPGISGPKGHPSPTNNSKLTFPGDFSYKTARDKLGCALRFELDYHVTDTWPRLDGLRQSVEITGCEFCEFLRKAIIDSRLERTIERTEREVEIGLAYFWRDKDGDGYGLVGLAAELKVPVGRDEVDKWDLWEWRDREEGGYWWLCRVVFNVEAGEGNCDTWLQLEAAPREEVLGKENLDSIRSLVDFCVNKCGHPVPPLFVPTRLLDLEAPDTSDGICLVGKEFLPATGEQLKYAALSYCWGSPSDAERQFKTTASNIAERMANIEFAALSHVMRDAVTATRKLGLRYLWVDATCIVQDSADDWPRESQQMDQIYTNAFITLCALVSSSCHEGLLERSDTLPIRFRSEINPSIHGTICLRYHAKAEYKYFISSAGKTCKYQGAWRERAWCFQEGLLSTRTLYFGESRLYMQCGSGDITEPFRQTLQPGRATNFSFDLEASASSKDEYLHKQWRENLCFYAWRQITNSADRLPAISGLAKRMATRIGATYIAGLWSDNLARGLEWVASTPDVMMTFDQYIRPFVVTPRDKGPTWSWAHVDCDYKYRNTRPRLDYRSECGIFSTHIELASEFNPFGRVEYGEIWLRGYVVALPSMLYKHILYTFPRWRADLAHGHSAQCYLDWKVDPYVEWPRRDSVKLPTDMLLLLTSSWVPSQDLERDSEDFKWTDYDKSHHTRMRFEKGSEAPVTEENYLDEVNLPFHSTQEETAEANEIPSGDAYRDAAGILLYPAAEEGKYYRVGYFESGWRKGGFKAFQNAERRNICLI